MFDKPEEISKNRYINNLTAEVKKFGLYGYYIKYTLSESPVNNGFYFICGYDANQCTDKNNKLDLMYHEQQMTHTARLDYYVIRITDNSPFAVRQAVISFALHSSTIKGILKKCKCPYELNTVSHDFIKLAEKCYSKSIDSTLSIEEREKYSAALFSFVEKAGKIEYENSTNDDIERYSLQSSEITKNSPPNQVSLRRMCFKARQIDKILIDSKYETEFEERLSKQPDILYWKSKVIPSELKIIYNKCIGLKEAPFGSVLFAYDSENKKFFKMQYFLVLFRGIFKYSIKAFRGKGYSLCSIGVREEDIYAVANYAKSLDIPLAIDYDKFYYDGSFKGIKNHSRDDCLYTLTFLKRDVQKMDAGLWSITTKLSETRYLNDEDFEKYVMCK